MSNCSEKLNISHEEPTHPVGYQLLRHMMPLVSASLGGFYCYILWVIFTHLKELGNIGYNICLSFIGLYDLLMLAKIGILDTLFDPALPAPEQRTVWLSFMHLLLYYGQFSTVSLLTTNRVIAMMYSGRYAQMFTVRRTVFACIAVSCVAVLLALTRHIPGSYAFCNGTYDGMNQFFGAFHSSCILIFLLSNLGAYCTLYFYLYKQRKEVVLFESRNTDYKILLQSFFIVILHFFLFILLTGAAISKAELKITMGIGFVLNIFNSGINPFLYLAFSSKIRNIVSAQCNFSKKVGPLPSANINAPNAITNRL